MSRSPLLLSEIRHLVASGLASQPNPDAASAAIYSAINSDFPSGHSHRSLATALTDQVFNRAVALIGLGQYPSVYLELHALLEEVAILLLPQYVAKVDQHAVVSDLVRRKTLSDVAPFYVRFGYWSKADLAFIKALAAIRNGIAHRNFDLLAKHLPKDKEERNLDSFRFDLTNSSAALASTVRLMIQAARPHKRSRSKRDDA